MRTGYWHRMGSTLSRIAEGINAWIPEGSPRRKLLQVLSIVLLFEGISVVVLFSKVTVFLGVASILIGALLLILLTPRIPSTAHGKEDTTFGVRLVDAVVDAVGGRYVVMVLGALVVVLTVAYNQFISSRSEYGDLDTLAILFGCFLLAYPFIVDRFKVEVTFTLVFLSLVVLILVVPQAVSSSSSGNGSSAIGNWYVHYMLAAPFSAILNLIGIQSTSSGSFVTIVFQDGTTNTLGISAYCAGLYSFSIFISAFFSFVMVFERLPRKILAIVLTAGLVVAYLGNLLRMVIIGVVGYYRGMEALLWAHENVGWIIFLSWSTVFWYVLLRYATKRSHPEGPPSEAN